MNLKKIKIKSAVPWLTVRRGPTSATVQIIIRKNCMDLVPFQLLSGVWHNPTNQSLQIDLDLSLVNLFCAVKFQDISRTIPWDIFHISFCHQKNLVQIWWRFLCHWISCHQEPKTRLKYGNSDFGHNFMLVTTLCWWHFDGDSHMTYKIRWTVLVSISF